MGNPFAVTTEPPKKPGTNGVSGSNGSSNTPAASGTQGNNPLASTDVYTFAGQNGGSMATTDGTFENYDGFTRSAPSSGDDDCEQAKSDAADSQSEAGSAESQANNAADQADEDKAALVKADKQQKNREKQTINTVTRNNGEIDGLLEENDTLEDEINDANAEIAALMAEDGETYTPEPLSSDDDNASPAMPAQGADNGGGQSQGVGDTGGNIDGGAAAPMAGGALGDNIFAMNSLPADGSTQYAPTSETAVAAQNNAAGNNQSQGNSGNNKAGQQNGAATRSAMNATGSSFRSFGATLPSAKGKNADRINQLLSVVQTKTAKRSSNSGTISSLRSYNNNVLSSAIIYANKAKAVASSKKASNQQGLSVAQGAQLVGTATTTTGGVITSIAEMKIAAPDPTGATKAAGLALLPWGIGTTAAGAATTTAATFAEGKTTDAIQQAGSSFSQTTSSISKLRSVKSS